MRLLLGGLGVANTMIMSVFTRIREIAILRVNGFSNAQIAPIIVGESALVSVVGAARRPGHRHVALFALKLVPALHGYVDVTIHPALMLVVVIAGLAHGHCRRALSGCVCHAHPRGGGASLRMSIATILPHSTTVVRTENVWKSYDEGAITVLKGVDFRGSPGSDSGPLRPVGLRQEHAAASDRRARLARSRARFSQRRRSQSPSQPAASFCAMK